MDELNVDQVKLGQALLIYRPRLDGVIDTK